MARTLIEAFPRAGEDADLGPEGVRIQPPASRTQRRLPEVAVGVLLVVGCALAAVLWSASAGDRVPVLALARAVPAGARLTDVDLAPLGVSADAGIVTIPATALSEVVGQVARVPLSQGTLLTADLLAADSAVPPGTSIVGLALAPGAVPTPELRPGDLVQVIGTPVATAPTESPLRTGVLVDAAEVFSVDDVAETTDLRWVAIVVPVQSAAEVSAAASQDAVRLAVVGREP